MSAVVAIDTDQIKTIGIAAVIAFVVIGVLLSFIVTKIVTKVISLVIFLALGGWVWQQRESVVDAVDACHFSPKFFGVTISLPDDVFKKCQQLQDQVKR